MQGRSGLEVARTDLALLVILSTGNDYMPGLTGMHMGALWSRYVALRTSNAEFLTRHVPSASYVVPAELSWAGLAGNSWTCCTAGCCLDAQLQRLPEHGCKRPVHQAA